MNQQTIRNLTLFELLARSWKRPSPIADVRFSADGSAVAFSGTDGSVAIAPTTDTEPPEERIRVSADLGQTTIRPRKNPPAPITAAVIRNDGDAPLAAYRTSGFVCGGGTGDVLGLSCTGEVEETLFRTEAGPVIAVDHSEQAGTTIATDGDHLYISRASGEVTRHGRGPGSHIEALAISPDGRQVAASFADGLSIWALGGSTAALHEITLPSRPHSLRWKADGKALACSLEGGGFGLVDLQGGRVELFGDFPASVQSLSWSSPADALVASGAFRIAAWSGASQQDGDRAALVTGRPGLVLVDAVAAHPKKALVAAGYANGQIVIAEVGARDEMLVRSSGGVVTALAWSADGTHLALGDASGTAAIVTFPHQMFK